MCIALNIPPKKPCDIAFSNLTLCISLFWELLRQLFLLERNILPTSGSYEQRHLKGESIIEECFSNVYRSEKSYES